MPRDETRRSFLFRAGIIAAPLFVPDVAGAVNAGADVDVRAHGARGDGRADDTRAIQSAIDAAARARGILRVPPGEYVSGALHLRSHLTVRLDAGASLIASRRDDAFDTPEPRGPRPVADAETADHGLYCRRVVGLRLRGIELGLEQADPRPAVLLDDVRDADVSEVRVVTPVHDPDGWKYPGGEGVPTGRHGVDPSNGAVVRVTGRGSARIRLGGSVHGARGAAVTVDRDVPALAVHLEGDSPSR